ncbi:MAG: hypothetical protein KAI79_18985 [Bacteroidales bacterium]|nr:hypothetical protein [Bacteroidales bacterium]
MKKINYLFIIIIFLLLNCEKNNDTELSDYSESEAIELNLRCYMIFNQYALKQSNTYENGAVEVNYEYSADIMNAQYQGKVDLLFDNYMPTNISFGSYSMPISNFTLNGAGYVIGLMDSYNGQYVMTYDGNLSGEENDKTFQINFHYEIIQAQSLSNVGYFEINGIRYDFSVDGSDVPSLVK